MSASLILSPKEAYELIRPIPSICAEDGDSFLGGEIEDISLRLYGLDPSVFPELADLFLPKGRHGRVRLILSSPYRARVYSLVAAILRSVR